MKTIDFSYFIERYIAGEMDKNEQEWFRKELEGNEKLKEEVELRKRTDKVLQNQNILNLRSKLAELEKQKIITGRNSVSPKSRSTFKYAAVLSALILVVGSIFIFKDNSMTSTEIIEKYYRPYEAPAVTRSAIQAPYDDYNTALEYYKIGDFKQAAVYFSKVIEQEPENMGSVLLNGISNYEIKNYPEAEGSFEKVIFDGNNYFVDHAQWYLGLCLIQTGELEKAKEQFFTVSKANTIYSRNAKRILKALN